MTCHGAVRVYTYLLLLQDKNNIHFPHCNFLIIGKAVFFFHQVFIAVGVLLCYAMGRDLEWNWLALVSCVFLFPFTFGLYFIPESPPWLVYNDEEDLAFKSMVLIRGEEYDATVEIR